MATKKIPTAIVTPAEIAQEIVAAAENSNNAITAKQNPTTPSLSLPAGQTTQTTFNINSFDPRFPTGFVTMVTDKNDNPVGYVKDGKVVPLLEPGYSLAEVEAQRNAKNPKPNPQLEATASAQARVDGARHLDAGRRHGRAGTARPGQGLGPRPARGDDFRTRQHRDRGQRDQARRL